ncbi:MAG: hypothetical protein J5983_01135 [Ruminococcus sp.]|nr:hypothetical protein [Ruminococcus sp.]
MGTQSYEELVSLYHNIMFYCAIAALIFLAAAIFLFFWLKIPQVFGELTGRTAQKAIDEMTAETAGSGSLGSGKVGVDGRRRRKGRTGSIGTGRLRKNTGRNTGNLGNSGSMPTDPLVQGAANGYETSGQYAQNAYNQPYTQPTEPMQDTYGSAPTDVLDSYGSQPTDVLDDFGSQPTDVLNYGSEETSVLDSGEQPTDVLSGYGSEPTAKMTDEYFTQQMNPTAPVYQAPESETMVLSQDLKDDGYVFVIERSIVEVHTDEVI